MNLLPDLSICTVTPGGDEKVFALLRSVEGTADPVAVETIVVVNGISSGGASQLDKMFPQSKILENHAFYPLVKCRNQALRLASGRYISLWDRDIILSPQCLLHLTSYLDEHPETGIAVPCLINDANMQHPSVHFSPSFSTLLAKFTGLSFLFPAVPIFRQHLPLDETLNTPLEIEWATGSAMVIRREVIEEIGFFNEKYLVAYDDADFFRRARKAGWHIVYLPYAKAYHHNRERYNPRRVLDIDPLSVDGAKTVHPEQLLDAARFLLA